MSNEEYIHCIVEMLMRIDDNLILKKIFEYVHRIFI